MREGFESLYNIYNHSTHNRRLDPTPLATYKPKRHLTGLLQREVLKIVMLGLPKHFNMTPMEILNLSVSEYEELLDTGKALNDINSEIMSDLASELGLDFDDIRKKLSGKTKKEK